MNAKERFIETVSFGHPDKIPLYLWTIRPLTERRWIKEGLPKSKSVAKYLNYETCNIGSILITSFPSEGFPWNPSPTHINLGPIPPFEYKIIREDEKYRVWVHSLGITQIGFQEDWKDGWSGFATRSFIEFPVKERKDFLDIKKRYDPEDPKRYPKNWKNMVKTFRKRDYPLCLSISGPFWWTRDKIGFKGTVMGLYKDPELIKEIMSFSADFQIEVLRKALTDFDLDIDYVIINEDIAYKKGPMIGPKLVKEFMVPSYRKIVRFFRNRGARVIFVDSDGDVSSLIPIWLDVGINGITPCEAASNMDVVKIGNQHPNLVMMGGIDKRELAKDIESIEKEVMNKVPPLIERRGYLPGVDHAVPPDVSFENYKYFVLLLKKICGWK